MDYEEIVISALIGGLGGLVGFWITKKFTPERWRSSPRLSSIITIICIVLPTSFYTSFNGPKRRHAHLKKQFEQSISKTGQLGALFEIIKREDPEGYAKMNDQIATIFDKFSHLTEAELRVKAQTFGGEFTAQYYRRASDQALSAYAKQLVSMFSKLAASKPILFCKVLNPAVYGSVPPGEFSNFSGFSEMLVSFEEVVRTAKENRIPKNNYAAVTYRDDLDLRFQALFPRETAAIQMSATDPEQKACPFLSKSFISYFNEIDKLPFSKRIAVWRLRLGGIE